MKRLWLLALLLAACGSPAELPPAEPIETPASVFSLAVRYPDPAVSAEVYTGRADALSARGQVTIRAEGTGNDGTLSLTLELPDLNQTSYTIGDDVRAQAQITKAGRVTFDGAALTGTIVQTGDEETFLTTLSLSFDGFEAGGTLGVPRQ